MAEKYPNISPYAYAFNNPVNIIDPTGMEGEDWIKNLETGEIKWFEGTGEYSYESAENYWGKDTNMEVLSDNYFDSRVFAEIATQKIEETKTDFFIWQLEKKS